MSVAMAKWYGIQSVNEKFIPFSILFGFMWIGGPCQTTNKATMAFMQRRLKRKLSKTSGEQHKQTIEYRKKACYSTGQTLVSLVFPCRRLFCGHYCVQAGTYDCKLRKTTGFFVSGGWHHEVEEKKPNECHFYPKSRKSSSPNQQLALFADISDLCGYGEKSRISKKIRTVLITLSLWSVVWRTRTLYVTQFCAGRLR